MEEYAQRADNAGLWEMGTDIANEMVSAPTKLVTVLLVNFFIVSPAIGLLIMWSDRNRRTFQNHECFQSVVQHNEDAEPTEYTWELYRKQKKSGSVDLREIAIIREYSAWLEDQNDKNHAKGRTRGVPYIPLCSCGSCRLDVLCTYLSRLLCMECSDSYQGRKLDRPFFEKSQRCPRCCGTSAVDPRVKCKNSPALEFILSENEGNKEVIDYRDKQAKYFDKIKAEYSWGVGIKGFSTALTYVSFGAWLGFCLWIFYNQYFYLIAVPNIKISPITFALGIDLNFELPRGQLPTRICATGYSVVRLVLLLITMIKSALNQILADGVAQINEKVSKTKITPAPADTREEAPGATPASGHKGLNVGGEVNVGEVIQEKAKEKAKEKIDEQTEKIKQKVQETVDKTVDKLDDMAYEGMKQMTSGPITTSQAEEMSHEGVI